MSIFNINGVGPYIKSFLTPKDLVVSERVSKQWEKDALNPDLWKQYGYESKEDFKRIFEESMNYVQSLRKPEVTLKLKHYVLSGLINRVLLKEMLKTSYPLKSWYFSVHAIEAIALGIFTLKEIADMNPQDRTWLLSKEAMIAITHGIFTPDEIRNMDLLNNRNILMNERALKAIEYGVCTADEIRNMNANHRRYLLDDEALKMIKAKILTRDQVIAIRSASPNKGLIELISGPDDECEEESSKRTKRTKRL